MRVGNESIHGVYLGEQVLKDAEERAEVGLFCEELHRLFILTVILQLHQPLVQLHHGILQGLPVKIANCIGVVRLIYIGHRGLI